MFFYPQNTVKKIASGSVFFLLEKSGCTGVPTRGRRGAKRVPTLVGTWFEAGWMSGLGSQGVNFFIKKY